MDEEKIQELIQQGRDFITGFGDQDKVEEDYRTNQDLKCPQPPLAKAPMTGNTIGLPTDFEALDIDNDFLHVVNSRKSRRVYTDKAISLRQLSYLLWCTQGVKEIRGKKYATLRTVPCGGARHEFECYMAVRKVEGLKTGLYHYLPMTHQVELLSEETDEESFDSFISDSLEGQSWGAKASVVFYYSCVFYRAEWRYGVWAHPIILIDAGHITENLYLAAESIGLGGCAVGAVAPDLINRRLGLDGKEESAFYAMPVGTVTTDDSEKEQQFYAFVKEEGL